mgnify:CR=1 FL=1
MAEALIHLSNIEANAQTFKRIAPNSKLLAVVKANAYGHGAKEVATKLNNLADAFAVARLSEALELHALSLDKKIVIMSEAIDAQLLQQCANNGFDLVIHSLEALSLLATTPLSQAIGVWLKIDTGMHRLGIQPSEFKSAVQLLQYHNNVAQLILMTHLASADEADPRSYLSQLSLFSTLGQPYNHPESMANTAACLRDGNCHGDWIRPGIGLYGEDPFIDTDISSAQVSLLPSMTLSAPIIAIRTVKAGDNVGYGDTWQAPRDSRIATVAIGYADGYPRALKNDTPTAVHGVIAPLVGRVSMDMISIDVSDIDNVAIGDKVELWGRNVSASKIAALAHTIPYTLFCGLGPRVDRVFEE